jgi:hypothetical protein
MFMDECLNWLGYKNKTGYGIKGNRINGKFKLRFVHRLEYEAWNGPIPDGLCVLHKCDNPSCYNIHHLFLGTRKDNNDDKIAKGRGKWARGEQSGRSKLTESQVIEIKRLIKQRKLNLNQISKLYGVTNMAIHRIKNGTAWKWLD